VQVDYATHPDTGMYALEEGLAEIGREADVPWLIHEIEALSEEEVVDRFNDWPDLAEPEGVWGSLLIDPYAVMCQLDVPPRHERLLGAEALLKIDRASTPDRIRERLRQLG
jgi:hypothetical protein